MTVSAFDHPWFSGLFGDDTVAALFSADRTAHSFLRFERALTKALGDHGVVDKAVADGVLNMLAGFAPDMDGIAAGMARDGVPGPAFVKQLKQAVGDDLAAGVHVGATSQDLSDTALVETLGAVNKILSERLREAVSALEELEARFGTATLMGRTRMQAAQPITVGHRVSTWRAPLIRHLQRLEDINPGLLVLQFSGAVGTGGALGDKHADVARQMAAELGLAYAPDCWHTTRDAIADYANWLSLVTGSLGKMGQDICLMAQQGLDEAVLGGGGGSSAMPHKRNPVKAEALVTLARFNAVQVGGMHQALVHEQERSGAAWSLEWLILPQMTVAAAASLSTGIALLKSIERLGDS
ncbi:3-carboxy-cis,cis-muconate cycloisomerase [Hwanghaeella grinnelliae]|uniref:3-carboxy-cis,cis-muconate cycloisomerase n=1 Tax=Hwanghaeella grinnelliae TaxID=2500179 RepID=A0A437QUK0_9PROT|nr:3-carboxy-cis,cis-muconate cycloisomerase [Hwanghaeella grinnelliae]RVU38181.1 3-carboxy-cis,cis-muconate cycloisomerase [Hwanghaeella grinnelliae]